MPEQFTHANNFTIQGGEFNTAGGNINHWNTSSNHTTTNSNHNNYDSHDNNSSNTNTHSYNTNSNNPIANSYNTNSNNTGSNINSGNGWENARYQAGTEAEMPGAEGSPSGNTRNPPPYHPQDPNGHRSFTNPYTALGPSKSGSYNLNSNNDNSNIGSNNRYPAQGMEPIMERGNWNGAPRFNPNYSDHGWYGNPPKSLDSDTPMTNSNNSNSNNTNSNIGSNNSYYDPRRYYAEPSQHHVMDEQKTRMQYPHPSAGYREDGNGQPPAETGPNYRGQHPATHSLYNPFGPDSRGISSHNPPPTAAHHRDSQNVHVSSTPPTSDMES